MGWKRKLLCGIGLAMTALPLLAAQAAPKLQPADLSGLVTMLSAGASKTIDFRDEHGRPISEAAFLQGVSQGHSFLHKRDEAARSTTFTLGAVETATLDKAQLERKLGVHYKVKPGQPLPAFDLATVGGGRVGKASLSGHPALINFFFADCVGCIAETPALNAYAKAHPDMRVLAVTFDDGAAAATYVKQRHFAWPVAYGGQHWLDALGVSAFPALALVGADGRLLDIRISGSIQSGGDAITASDLQRWVAGTLAKQPAK